MFKPFRPPTFLTAPNEPSSTNQDKTEGPPLKRQRLDQDSGANDKTSGKAPATRLVFKSPGISVLPRPPLDTVENPTGLAADGGLEDDSTYYSVLWRKPTGKKHKTWDGDGILRVAGGFAHLQDSTGKEMGRIACSNALLPESILSIGGRDVEVDSLLSREDYFARKRLLGIQPRTNHPLPLLERPLPKPKPVYKIEADQAKEAGKKILNTAAPKSLATQAKWKNPVLETTVLPRMEGNEPIPRHDPNAPEALVMSRPPLKDIPKGRQVVDVVVDPVLSRRLREHQREGVKFLYDCVMGWRGFDGQGAILADDMGLGKTLQTIALLWTLFKQSPVYEADPVIKKALIVCPVTLIENWRQEFRKWLGNERLGVFIADGKKTRIKDFTRGKAYNVMIIGYERLRTVAEDLQKGAGIDIVIADEGHRLKTEKNKAAQAIKSLNTARRVILSGTPIQNDLSEFFAMVDFVNPGILGTLKSFTKEFEMPIVKSRQPDASRKDIEKGETRSEELAETTAMFILRRTADVLSKFLPIKTEYVLMCRPTSTQAAVYKHVLASPIFQSALGSSENALQLITILKKVCNSPKLLSIDPAIDPEKNSLAGSLASTLPPALLRNNAASTKLRVLDQMLHTLRNNTEEKIVLVSNFTSTLDLLSTLLTSLSMPFLRLDGCTASSKRQELVDTFNRTPASSVFAFLLSAKAGGMGLNLIGASRLVLFDVDWNPAIDAQAMARIHRDGQKRPCHIYRLLMAGGLDEKIWQRQVTKLGLASSVMEAKSGTASFTREELRDLFRLDESRNCQTHQLIGCGCNCRGLPETTLLDEGWPEEESANMDANDIEDGSEAGEDEEETLKAEDGTLIKLEGKKKRPRETQSHDRKGQELPSLPAPIKCSQLNMAAQERNIREATAAARGKKESAKMQSLMSYSHIDTSTFATDDDDDKKNVEALIHDEVLLSVLKDEGNMVDFIFAKTTG